MSIFELFSQRRARHAGTFPPKPERRAFSARLRDALYLRFIRCIGRYDDSINYISEPFAGNELWNYYEETLRTQSDEYYGFKFKGTTSVDERIHQFFLNSSDTGFIDALDLAVAIVAHGAESLHQRIGAYEWSQFGITLRASDALAQMDTLLRSEGTVLRIADGRIIISTDDFTHTEVTVPALHALSYPGFENALREFHEALNHHRMGEHSDALTKASHAFESTMKIVAAKSSWAYDETDTASKLVALMISKGLFQPMRESALNGLRTMLESDVPTLRNKTPKAGHGAGTRIVDVPESIAAYAITVAAANIRLLISEWRSGAA